MAVALRLQSFFSSLGAILLLLGLLSYESFASEDDKISLADFPLLRVELGRLTSGRKSPRVPQMKCDGGSAGCGYPLQPRTMNCLNQPTTQPRAAAPENPPGWICRQTHSTSPHFVLSNIRVSCEGYDHQEDSHVLRGSCGVEYELDILMESNNSGYITASYYARTHGFSPWEWSSLLSLFITLIITAAMIYGLLSSSRRA